MTTGFNQKSPFHTDTEYRGWVGRGIDGQTDTQISQFVDSTDHEASCWKTSTAALSTLMIFGGFYCISLGLIIASHQVSMSHFICILLTTTLLSPSIYFTTVHFTSHHCSALHCTELHFTSHPISELHCTELHCTSLHFSIVIQLHYSAISLQSCVLNYTVLTES